jgi:hypothetical protein
MGVKGFYRLLQKEGWLPDESASPCCSTSLWRDASVMHACPRFASRVSLINPRSTLLLDGPGLSFHLYRVAYARHTARVLGKSENCRSSTTATSCQSSVKKLRPEQATKLVPNLLPLPILDEVTREFVDTLKKKHHMKLVVYFDGELRREVKRETDEKRQKRRPTEWSALQQYCCNGVMPSVDRCCQWEDQFPKNRLFIQQIQFTLRLCQVEIVMCEEEADQELAKHAARERNSYVVGNDTDFCFFKKAKYIPLKTLHAADSVVTACIISRKDLADSLDLPDDEAMVELAILLGNDYVGDSWTLDFHSTEYKVILDNLRKNGKGYRVSSSDENQQNGIAFSRAMYNLENLDQLSPLSPKGDFDDDLGDYSGLKMKVPGASKLLETQWLAYCPGVTASLALHI